MNDTVIVAGLVITGPVILAWLTGRQAHAAQRADWKRQDIVAKRAEVAAAANAAASAKSARLLEEANIHAIGVDDKLSEIHGIVNSAHTTALRAELAALEQIELLLEQDIHRDAEEGLKPAVTKANRLAGVRASISDLERVLADRDTQQDAVDKQAGKAKERSSDAARAARMQVTAADRQIKAADAQTEAAEAQTRASEARDQKP